MPDVLAHVHETIESVAVVEMTPPHPPRIETPEYRKAHSFLINRKNKPCHICGVTKRTLKTPGKNPYGATAIETHHYPIERSLIDACDPAKVHADFPQVYDRASLLAFVDTPANLLVLCDQCHRSPERGIHHLLTQDWIVQRYLLSGYKVAATQAAAAAVLAADEQIEQRDMALERTVVTVSAPAATDTSPALDTPSAPLQRATAAVSSRPRPRPPARKRTRQPAPAA